MKSFLLLLLCSFPAFGADQILLDSIPISPLSSHSQDCNVTLGHGSYTLESSMPLESNMVIQDYNPGRVKEESKPVQTDDDEDAQVVLANVANMLYNIGTISTDPHNPAVVGPSIAQIGASFINIIAQVFKGMPIRGEITHEQIEAYFRNLPQEVRDQLIALIVVYADLYHKGGF